MPDLEQYLPWKEAGWFEQAQAWIETQLTEQKITITGAVEQVHERPWSTILRVPTDQGFFFMKASAPALSHEPGLSLALFQWRPDCMLAVLAVDRKRGWMLLPDLNPWLRALIQSPQDLGHWETILPLYAEVQQDFASHTEQLRLLGMFDRRLARLPELFAQLLEDRAALLIDQPEGLTFAQYQHLLGLQPRFQEMCEQLSQSGLPETLHHDDFHDGNIFLQDGRYVFSDWGESCVTYPFFSMLVTLRSIAYRFDWPYGTSEYQYQFAPQLLALRDLYLQQWTVYAEPDELQKTFQVAWRAAMINRALTWYHVTSQLAKQDRMQHASAVPAWLGEFLDVMAQADEQIE